MRALIDAFLRPLPCLVRLPKTGAVVLSGDSLPCLVRLPKTGAVVLSGDLVHFRDNFEARRAPSFNFNQKQSLQSIDKVAALLKVERGQLWINHDSAQSATIPHAPQYVQ